MEKAISAEVRALRESVGLTIMQAADLVGFCNVEEWMGFEYYSAATPDHVLTSLIKLNDLRVHLEELCFKRLKEQPSPTLEIYSNISDFRRSFPSDNPLCFYLYRIIVRKVFSDNLAVLDIELMRSTDEEEISTITIPELKAVVDCVRTPIKELQ